MTPEKINNRQRLVLTPTPTPTPSVRQTANTQTIPLVSQKTGVRENFQKTSNANYVNSLDEKTRKAIQDKLKKEYEKLQTQLNKAKKQNGPIGWAWDGIKNLTGLGAGSNKVQVELNKMKKQLADLEKNPAHMAKVYKNITGKDLNREEVTKLSKGQIESKANVALNKYTKGQATAVDAVADVLSGIAVIGIYSAAVAAAPFSGGASIAVGILAAGVSAAAIKTGIKYADAKLGGRKYDSLGYDLATGALNGALAPLTGGFGGAMGRTVALTLTKGVQIAGEEVVEQTVKQTFGTVLKESVAKMMLNPAGYEYIGGKLLGRVAAIGTEMAVDGSLSGGFDNALRAGFEGENVVGITKAFGTGVVGGLIAAPLIGGGFRLVGRTGGKLGEKLFKRPEGHMNAGIDDLSNIKTPTGEISSESAEQASKEYIQDFLDVFYTSSKYSSEKNTLLTNLNEDNIDFISHFLQNRGGGDLSVDKLQKLIELAKAVNAENKDVLTKWSNIKTSGQYICDFKNLKDIACKITTNNKAIFLKLAETQSFKALQIVNAITPEMIDKITPEIEDIMLKMIEKKAFNGKDAYTSSEVLETTKKAIDFMAQNTDEVRTIVDIIKSKKLNVADKATVLKNLKNNNLLSENYLADLKKIMNDEPIIKTYKANTPIENIKDVPIGDVVQVGNKLYVNDNGDLIELQMTKKKYLELFPPGSRFNTNQGKLSDCWLVSTIDHIMDNPNYRSKLYQLFRQEGNDIYIKFPDGKKEIKFDNSEIMISPDGKNLDGALGLQIIEQAYSIHRMNEYPTQTFKEIRSIIDVSKQMEKLHDGSRKEALYGILGTKNIKIIEDTFDKNKYIDIIENYSNNPNVLLSFGTIKKGNKIEEELNINCDLYSEHAYSIKHYNKKKGIVYIANPWHTSIVTEVPIENLIKYINNILVIQTK